MSDRASVCGLASRGTRNEERGRGGSGPGAAERAGDFLVPRSSFQFRFLVPRSSFRRVPYSAFAFLLAACPWFTTFTDQPRQEPWEQQWSDTITWLGVRPESLPSRGNPQFSVPIYGTSVAAFVVSSQPTPGALDSLALISNPTPVSDSSLANGRRHFQINCAVCHGAAGAGDGPVTKYGLPAPSLLADPAKNRSDGYIYGVIRNGRGLMPSYNRVEDMDRWDVVNYLRGLQGRLGAPVSTEPAGQPGENGPAVPTHSLTAPTRPVPYARPAAVPNAGPADTTHAAAPAPPGAHR